MSNWIIHQTIDLSRGHEPVVVWPHALMIPGDHAAHTWEVEVKQYGKPVDLTGFRVKGLFITSGADSTLSIDGTISGNIASVELTMECYVEGPLRGVMQLTRAGVVMSICETFFTVRNPWPEQILIPNGRPAGNGEAFYVELSSDENGNVTANATLAEVEEAYADGRNIYCLCPEDGAYLICPMVAYIPGQTVVFNTTAGNSTLTTRLTADGVTVANSALTLRNPITFTGAVSETYDGTSAVSIPIPELTKGMDGADGITYIPKIGTVTTGAAGSAAAASVDVSDAEKTATFNFTIPRGNTGANGSSGSDGDDGVGIASIEQTTTSTADEGVNVLTITLTDGTTATFQVRNGSQGSAGSGGTGGTGADGEDGVGIVSIEQTTTSTADGGVNVITITLSDGSSSSFEVRNGSKGSTGATGPAGADGEDGSDATVTVDSELSETSTNPVQNKVIYAALQNLGGSNIVVSATEPETPTEGMIWLDIS